MLLQQLRSSTNSNPAGSPRKQAEDTNGSDGHFRKGRSRLLGTGGAGRMIVDAVHLIDMHILSFRNEFKQRASYPPCEFTVLLMCTLLQCLYYCRTNKSLQSWKIEGVPVSYLPITLKSSFLIGSIPRGVKFARFLTFWLGGPHFNIIDDLLRGFRNTKHPFQNKQCLRHNDWCFPLRIWPGACPSAYFFLRIVNFSLTSVNSYEKLQYKSRPLKDNRRNSI